MLSASDLPSDFLAFANDRSSEDGGLEDMTPDTGASAVMVVPPRMAAQDASLRVSS
jgi:hypothetical protein